MKIELLRLKNNIEKNIIIKEKIEFSKEQLENTELLDLVDVIVDGNIIKDNMDNINIYLNVTGKMVLPCAITLEPVEHKFEFTIDDNLENVLEEVKNDKKIENTIDILPIIWENILMEIPMRVVSLNAKPEKLKGNGWQFVTEQIENVNPELEKLKDLL